MLAPAFAGRPADLTEENIQARIRGVTLMALSNKLGAMLLTTGNKSEMAVGYATLYGDMCGGYNVLKDLYKVDVYALCAWRNANAPFGGPAAPIPARVLTKAPSAELRPDQTDQDSLPPYEDLDAILRGLVEEEATLAEIVARGHDPKVVARVQTPALRLGIQAATSRPWGEDRRPRLRPRPALSAGQSVSRGRPRPVIARMCQLGGVRPPYISFHNMRLAPVSGSAWPPIVVFLGKMA